MSNWMQNCVSKRSNSMQRVIFELLEGRRLLSGGAGAVAMPNARTEVIVSVDHALGRHHYHHHYHHTHYHHAHTVPPDVLFGHFTGVGFFAPADLTFTEDSMGNASGSMALAGFQFDANFVAVAYADGTFSLDADGHGAGMQPGHATLHGYTSKNGDQLRGTLIINSAGEHIQGPFVMNRVG